MSPNEELKTRWYFLHKTLNKATFNTEICKSHFLSLTSKSATRIHSMLPCHFGGWLCLSPNKQIGTAVIYLSKKWAHCPFNIAL